MKIWEDILTYHCTKNSFRKVSTILHIWLIGWEAGCSCISKHDQRKGFAEPNKVNSWEIWIKVVCLIVVTTVLIVHIQALPEHDHQAGGHGGQQCCGSYKPRTKLQKVQIEYLPPEVMRRAKPAQRSDKECPDCHPSTGSHLPTPASRLKYIVHELCHQDQEPNTCPILHSYYADCGKISEIKLIF